MFRTDYVSLNNGGNIVIASYESYQTTYRLDFCYSEGNTAPCTVLSTLSQFDEAMTKEIIPTSLFQDFARHRTDEQLEQEEYLAMKQYIEDNTVWIWGDLEHGGCFYYNGGVTNKCSLGACYGFLQDNDDLKFYSIIRETNGFTRVESNEVAFAWNGTFLSSELQPSLTIWYINQGYRDETITNDSPYYADYEELTGEWPFTNSVILQDLLANNNWVDRLIGTTRVPFRLWNNASRNASLILKSLNATVTTNTLYGNILGDSEIDPDVNPSYKGGVNKPSGGDGDYPNKSDDVDFADPENDIDVDAVNSGFITLYNPTKQEIKSFSDFLWTDITDSLSQQIKRMIANPLDAVLFIAKCHFQPPTTGLGKVISYCGISSGVSSLLINKQYFTLDCGTLNIGESCKNFLDYNPYSKCHLFLPYVGINPIDINDVMGSTIAIKYNIDLVTGSALAQVKITRNERREGDAHINSVLYDFPCNVYEQLPLSGSDWRQAVGNMSALIGGAVGVATGNGAGLGAMASAVASQQVSVVRSGSASGNYGYISNQKPYIILERPIENMPANFPMYEGLPCNITYRLGNVRGYTEVETGTFKTDWFLGTEEEMNELKELLDGGVFL